MPKEHITPMSAILKASDRSLNGDTLTGQTAECTLDEQHFRRHPDYPNASQAWLGGDVGGFWRNVREDKIREQVYEN